MATTRASRATKATSAANNKAPRKTTVRPMKRAPRQLDPSEHAKRLYAFLQTEWDRMDIRPTTWCRINQIPNPTVIRWSRGVEPDVRNLRKVAEALGRSFLDILLVAGYISEDEAKGYTVPERTYDAREAIRLDDNLSDFAREATLQFLDSIEEVESGQTKRVKMRSRG